ncbi:MAG: DUF6531 domain-containing protein, partial [Anaeroplasmataceae bacterium]
MKVKQKLSILILIVFILTTFQTEIKVMADTFENTANRLSYLANDKTLKNKDVQGTNESNNKTDDKIKNNEEVKKTDEKKVKIPFVNGVENTEDGLRIWWDKVDGATYEVEINGEKIEKVKEIQYVYNDKDKINSQINFRIRSVVDESKSDWSSNYGGFLKLIEKKKVEEQPVQRNWVDTQNGIVDLDTGSMVERFREPDNYTPELKDKTVVLKKNTKGYDVIGSFRIYNLKIEPGVTVNFKSRDTLTVTGNLEIGDKNSKEKVNLIRNLEDKGEQPAWYGPMISIWKIEYNDSRVLKRSIQNSNVVDKLKNINSDQSIVVRDVDVVLENNTIVSQAKQAVGISNNVSDYNSSNQKVTAINNKIITTNEGIVVKGAYLKPIVSNKAEVSVQIENNTISSNYKGITLAEVYNEPLITEYQIKGNNLINSDYTTLVFDKIKELNTITLNTLDTEVNNVIVANKDKNDVLQKESYKISEGIKIDIKNFSMATCSISNNTVKNYKTAIVNTNGRLAYTGNNVINAVEGIRTTVDDFYIGTISNLTGTNTFSLNNTFIDEKVVVIPIAVNNSGDGMLRVNNAKVILQTDGIAIKNEGVFEVSGLSEITGKGINASRDYTNDNSIGILNDAPDAISMISRSYVTNFDTAIKSYNGDIIALGLETGEVLYPVVGLKKPNDTYRSDSTISISSSNLIKINSGTKNGVNIINTMDSTIEASSTFFQTLSGSNVDKFPVILKNITAPVADSCIFGKVSIEQKAYAKIDIKTVAESIPLTENIPNYDLYRNFGNDGSDPATGNFGKTFEDFNKVFKYFDFSFSRSYNSMDIRKDGIFGDGWRFSFQGKIEEVDAKQKIKQVTLPNGSIVTFKEKTDGTFESIDSRNKLIKDKSGYILETKEKMKYYFNDKGLLSSIEDKNLNKLTVEYHTNNQIKRIVDLRKSELVFKYKDAANTIIEKITENINGKEVRSTSYVVEVVNGAKLLKSSTNTYGKVFTYGYNANNQVNIIKSGDEVLDTVDYKADKKVNKHKDSNNNEFSYEYDTENRQTIITDSNKLKKIERYDKTNNETFTSYSDGTTVVTTYQLDNGVNKYGEVRSQKDRSGLVRSYERDSNGNMVKELVNSKVTKEYQYDTNNNQTAEKAFINNGAIRTFFVYDEKGNVKEKLVPKSFDTADYKVGAVKTNYVVTSFEYEDKTLVKGLLKKEVEPNGTKTYTYDDRGNLTEEVDKYGAKKTYLYNYLDQIRQETQNSGNKIYFIYDKNSNVVKKEIEVDPFRTNAAKLKTPNIIERFEYNNDGYKIKEIYGDLYSTAKEPVTITGTEQVLDKSIYNGDANIIYNVDAIGKNKTETRKISGEEQYVTSYEYDIYGYVNKETKPNNAKYTYINDDEGKVTTTYIEENGVNILLETHSYQRNSDGGYIEISRKYLNKLPSEAGNNYIQTRSVYNYLGKEVEVTNGEDSTKKAEYDLQGNVIREVNSTGNETVYNYNAQGKVKSVYRNVYLAASNKESSQYNLTEYNYDDLGQVIEEKQGVDKVTTSLVPAKQYNVKKIKRAYDTTTKTEKVTTEYGVEVSAKYTVDANLGRVETFDYNGNKIKEETTYEKGKVKTVDYVNTLQGEVREKIEQILESDIKDAGLNTKIIPITTSYEFNARGQVVKVNPQQYETFKGFAVSYTYDYQGRVTGTTQVDNANVNSKITSSKSYNFYNDVVTSKDGRGTELINEYDSRGRLTKVKQAKPEEAITAYEYDNADRLIREVAPKNYIAGKELITLARKEYIRDNVGRVLAEVEIGKVNNANIENKTVEYVDKTIVTKGYVYDGNGNIVKEIDGYNLPEVTGENNYISNVQNLKDTLKGAIGKEIKYDGINNVTEFISAENKSKLNAGTIASTYEEQYIYDGLGRKIKVNKAEGTIVDYSYDIFNNNTKIAISSKTNAAVTVITNKFDGLSRLISTIDGDGYESTFKYNNFDKLQSEAYTVDKTLLAAEKETKNYIYDVTSNLTKWKNTQGEFEDYKYDAFGRLVTTTTGDKTGSVVTKDIKELDGNGNPKVIVNAESGKVEINYDENNRPSTVKTTTMPGTPTDNTFHISRYTYDKNGNVLAEEKQVSKDDKIYTTIGKNS